MDLVRFQVAYWRVSNRRERRGVVGRSVVDCGETHTRRFPMIPCGRLSDDRWQQRLRTKNTHVSGQ